MTHFSINQPRIVPEVCSLFSIFQINRQPEPASAVEVAVAWRGVAGSIQEKNSSSWLLGDFNIVHSINIRNVKVGALI